MSKVTEKSKHTSQRLPVWMRSRKLTFWLVILTLTHLFYCFVLYLDLQLMQVLGNRFAASMSVFVGMVLVLQSINFLLILALWNMRLWAFPILVLTIQINCLAVLSGGIFSTGSAILILIVLFVFVRPEIQKLKETLH